MTVSLPSVIYERLESTKYDIDDRYTGTRLILSRDLRSKEYYLLPIII